VVRLGGDTRRVLRVVCCCCERAAGVACLDSLQVNMAAQLYHEQRLAAVPRLLVNAACCAL
jgi:hypothetical protein